jgi:chromosome segregation ATPase
MKDMPEFVAVFYDEEGCPIYVKALDPGEFDATSDVEDSHEVNVTIVEPQEKQVETVQPDMSLIENRIREQIGSSLTEIDSLKTKTGGIENQLKSLKAIFLQRLDDIDTTASRLAKESSSENIELIKRRFDSVDSKVSNLSSDYNSLTGDIQVLTNRISELKTSLDSLNSDQATSDDELREILKALDSRMIVFEKQLSGFKNEIKSSILYEFQNNEKLNSVLDDITRFGNSIVEFESSLIGVRDRVAALSLETASNTEAIDSIKNSVMELGVKVDQKIGRLSELTNNTLQMIGNLTTRQDEIQAGVSGNSEKIDSIEKAISVVNEKTEGLPQIKEDTSNVKIQQMVTNEKIDSLAQTQAELSSKQDSIISNQDNIFAKQDGIITNQAELSAKQDSLSARQDELSVKQDENFGNISTEMMNLSANVDNRIDSMESRISNVDQKVTGADEKLSTVSYRTSMIEERIPFLEKVIEDSSSKQDELGRKILEKTDELSVKQNMLDSSFTKRTEELEARYEEVTTKLVDKTSRKWERFVKKLTEKKKGPSITKASYMFRKRLDVKTFKKVVIVSDKSNLSLAELFFDVAKKRNDNTILVAMSNRKKSNEEPEDAIRQVMEQADLIIITARYSLKDTGALRDLIIHGKEVVAINKALRITRLNEEA